MSVFLLGLGMSLFKPPGPKPAVISAVFEGEPAETAGLVVGDNIITIDGATTEGMSQEDLASMILGPPGSIAELVMQRSNQRPQTVTLQRKQAPSPSSKYDFHKRSSRAHTTSQPLRPVQHAPPAQYPTQQQHQEQVSPQKAATSRSSTILGSVSEPAQAPIKVRGGNLEVWQLMHSLCDGDAKAENLIQSYLGACSDPAEADAIERVAVKVMSILNDMRRIRESGEREREVEALKVKTQLDSAVSGHKSELARIGKELEAISKARKEETDKFEREIEILKADAAASKKALQEALQKQAAKEQQMPPASKSQNQADVSEVRRLQAEASKQSQLVAEMTEELSKMSIEVTKRDERIRRLELEGKQHQYLESMCEERGRQIEHLHARLAKLETSELAAKNQMEREKMEAAAQREATKGTQKAAASQAEIIAKLQAQIELGQRITANLTGDNEAALRELAKLSDKCGNQEQEILRLNGIIIEMEDSHKVQIQRVNEAAERWAMKRNEAIKDAENLKFELDRRDEIIAKHRQLLTEYQQVLDIMNQSGGPTQALTPLSL